MPMIIPNEIEDALPLDIQRDIPVVRELIKKMARIGSFVSTAPIVSAAHIRAHSNSLIRPALPLPERIRANRDRDQAVRCLLRVADDGFHVEPTGPQGSHVLSSMLGAGALAVVPASTTDLREGDHVVIELL